MEIKESGRIILCAEPAPPMSNKSLHFVVCTGHTEEDFKYRSETYKFIKDNDLVPNVDFTVLYENKDGLSSVYNKFLTEKCRGRIVVFIHDDIKLGYHFRTLTRELNDAHDQFDIVGLAGATKLSLSTPTLWHIMQKGASGSVGHIQNGLSQMSNYGYTPCKCITVDGLFISVNVDAILKSGHRFDERFRFHHYDIDFCIQADKCGLKIGTWPIWVTHLSPGLTSFEKNDWKKSNELFCQKYDII